MVNMPTFQWSDVQRDPTKVEKAVKTHGRVSLQRRGRSTLLLVDEADEQAAASAISAAAALLRALIEKDGRFPLDALLRAFPWAAVFNDMNRRAMAQELADLGLGGAALGDLRAFHVAVRQWKNTAEAKAAGVDLSTPIDSTKKTFGAARRPGAGKKSAKRGSARDRKT